MHGIRLGGCEIVEITGSKTVGPLRENRAGKSMGTVI